MVNLLQLILIALRSFQILRKCRIADSPFKKRLVKDRLLPWTWREMNGFKKNFETKFKTFCRWLKQVDSGGINQDE